MRRPPKKSHNDQLKPGDACGPYEIVSTLGRGGYGIVYKAVHRDTAEEVALKVVLHRHAEDERAAERLILEARAVRRVSHVNVVGYRDSDRLPDGEGSWLALELVHGQTLGHILRRRRRLPLRTALHLGVQLCEGLTKIHEVPLVHRDIKPYNLMITKAGTLKIIDLGIVRTKRGAGTRRQVGSGYYSAPDYLRLSAEELEGTIDPRWDLYSAGLVLWEMIGGHHPLRPKGEDLSLGAILAHYIKDRSLPRLSLPNLPESVADVVAKAVAFDPDQRWQTAKELGTALQDQLERPPVPRRSKAVDLPPASVPSGTDPLSAQELALFQQAEIQAEIAFETARTKPLKLPRRPRSRKPLSRRQMLRRQARTIPIKHASDEKTDPVIKRGGDEQTDPVITSVGKEQTDPVITSMGEAHTDPAVTAPLGGALKAFQEATPVAFSSEEQTDPVITAPLGSAIKALQAARPTARSGRGGTASAPTGAASARAASARAASAGNSAKPGRIIAVDIAPGPPSIGPVPRDEAPASGRAAAPLEAALDPISVDVAPSPPSIGPVPHGMAPGSGRARPADVAPAVPGVVAVDMAPSPPSIGPVPRGMPAGRPAAAPVSSGREPAGKPGSAVAPGTAGAPGAAGAPGVEPGVIAMPVKRRPAPLAPQRVIVQERGGPPGQGAAGAQQSLQQQALSSGPGTGYSAGPHAHKPFLQRQLSQRQFEIALTVLIAVGGITLMLIVLRLLGVI